MTVFSTLLAVCCFHAAAWAEMSVPYSGTVKWDDATATLTFHTSGAMSDSKEGFFFDVPAEVKRIVIDANVQMRGGFRVRYRAQDNPLQIVGKDRKTSVVFGTDEEAWTTRNGIPENDKWKYSSISVIEDAVVHVSNLTCQNPRGYLISGYANNAVIHLESCSLVDTRSGDNNNSDGFAGAAGSSIKNCFISTADDGIKLYRDITIENTIIEQHRNGAPLQFGWGGETKPVRAEIKGLVIKGIDPENRYNMAPLTWERGQNSVRNVFIQGLTVDLQGQIYDEETMTWQPIGLFELKPSDCEFNLSAVDASLNGLPLGVRRTKGKIDIKEHRN